MLQRAIQLLFHALPLAAWLWDGRTGIVAASILFVAMPYIKVKKLTAQLADAEQAGQSFRSEELRKLIERWRYLVL